MKVYGTVYCDNADFIIIGEHKNNIICCYTDHKYQSIFCFSKDLEFIFIKTSKREIDKLEAIKYIKKSILNFDNESKLECPYKQKWWIDIGNIVKNYLDELLKSYSQDCLKKKNQKKTIRPINITTTERVDIEKTFRIVSKTIEDLKKNGKIYPGPEYREKYIHLEEPNECNICYNTYRENFKCKRCVFKC